MSPGDRSAVNVHDVTEFTLSVKCGNDVHLTREDIDEINEDSDDDIVLDVDGLEIDFLMNQGTLSFNEMVLSNYFMNIIYKVSIILGMSRKFAALQY